jgi:outer membrane immunogenic protein
MSDMTTAARVGRLGVLAGALALATAPAFAGGVAQPAPAPAVIPAAPAPMPSADWTGFYAGAQIEYGDVGVAGAATDSGDGFLGGVFAGYRYDFGSFVVGGELDVNAADINLPTVGGDLASVSRLGLEAGFDAGNMLFYGTAGAAVATVDVGADTLRGNGYFYGIGMDYAVTDTMTIGAELLQHEFEDFDNTPGLDVDALTFGVNAAFRF